MTTWQHWVNFILGLWLIISAFVGFDLSGMSTNLIVVGIVVAILGLWGALQIQSASGARSQMSRM